jgi:hypothetical protein
MKFCIMSLYCRVSYTVWLLRQTYLYCTATYTDLNISSHKRFIEKKKYVKHEISSSSWSFIWNIYRYGVNFAKSIEKYFINAQYPIGNITAFTIIDLYLLHIVIESN